MLAACQNDAGTVLRSFKLFPFASPESMSCQTLLLCAYECAVIRTSSDARSLGLTLHTRVIPALLLAARLPVGEMLPLPACQKIPTRLRLLRPYFLEPREADINFIIKRIAMGHLLHGCLVWRVFV